MEHGSGEDRPTGDTRDLVVQGEQKAVNGAEKELLITEIGEIDGATQEADVVRESKADVRAAISEAPCGLLVLTVGKD